MASIDSLKASDGSGNASVATVSNSRSPLATTIQVDTVQGINDHFFGTMGTPHTFTDPVTNETITVISEATAVDFRGHVDGSNLEIDEIAPGYTDAGSSVGDIVIIRPTTQWGNQVAEVLEVSHNDDGTIKNDAVDTNQLVDAAVETAKIADDAVTAAKIDSTTLYAGAASSYVATSQATANQTYAALTTAQALTVTVGASGKLLVGINVGDAQNNTQNSQAWISFSLSGANTVAAGSSTIEAKYQAYTANAAGSINATALLTGLTPGSTTVTMLFKASANTATFGQRLLWVLPL